MELEEIANKNEWEDVVRESKEKTFLHSWQWGDFQESLGETIWRFILRQQGRAQGVVLVVKVHAKRGNFLFVPQGPIMIDSKSKNQSIKLRNEAYKSLIACLKELALKEDCTFIRISPILEDTRENNQLFYSLGFREAPLHMHAELSWVLDISKSEEELLAGMRKTTRNLIRRGQREGVMVRAGTLEEFYSLYKETEKRQRFNAFSKDYLEKEQQAFPNNSQVYLALHNDTVLAGAFIVYHEGTIYYHHGASLHAKVPAAYTLQWEIIRQAKAKGMTKYNFWGIVSEDKTKHPWYGLSLFKRGFGGQEWSLAHAKDFALSYRYWFGYGVDTMRKWKKRY